MKGFKKFLFTVAIILIVLLVGVYVFMRIKYGEADALAKSWEFLLNITSWG